MTELKLGQSNLRIPQEKEPLVAPEIPLPEEDEVVPILKEHTELLKQIEMRAHKVQRNSLMILVASGFIILLKVIVG